MRTPGDRVDELRAELRRLYREAPGGTWTAPGDQSLPGGVVAVDAAGRRTYLGAFFYGESAARLAAAARNALSALFRVLDDARAARSVPIVGTIGPGGVIAWREAASDPTRDGGGRHATA